MRSDRVTRERRFRQFVRRVEHSRSHNLRRYRETFKWYPPPIWTENDGEDQGGQAQAREPREPEEPMPYISQERREAVDTSSAQRHGADNPGELNYQITRLLTRYLQDHGLSYRSINDALGALEGAKLEFYHRVAGPYEFRKLQQNGDVYPPDLVRYTQRADEADG